MRCKAGDLCVVVNDQEEPRNDGALVKVLRPARRIEYALPVDWECEAVSLTLHVRELSSLDDFTHGRASLQQWFDLCNVVNLCETLGKEGIGPEALPYCKTAEVELIAAARRFQSTQRMGLSGPGITAMREVIEYHDAQRSSISRSQYEQMIRLTQARVRSGHETQDIGELLGVA